MLIRAFVRSALVIALTSCAMPPSAQLDAKRDAPQRQLAQTDQGASDSAPEAGESDAAPDEPERPELPAQELTDGLLYELLLSEIAAQRGETGLSAQMAIDLARRTRDPRVARRAMELAGSSQQRDQAIEAALLWHDIDPKSIRALQSAVALLVSAGRIEQAEPLLARLLSRPDARPETGFMQLARLFERITDTRAMLAVVRRLAEPFQSLPEAHFALARAARAAHDQDLALKAIRRAGALRPDWQPAALFEAELLRRADLPAATARLEQFLAKQPANRDVRMSYARLLIEAKRGDDARTQFERLLADHPGNGEVTYAVGLLALQLKDYAIAERNMRRLLDAGYRDSDSVRYTLGQIGEERKDWQGAIRWYESIADGDHFLPARLRVANVMSKQDSLERAREYLRKVKTTGREQGVQLVVAEAQLLREANRHAEAFDVLERALEPDPKQPDLLYDLALTAEKLDRFEVLEAKLRQLIALRPSHAHAYNALGYSFADRNIRLTEARELIEKALGLSPDDSFIIDSMGWVLFRQGDLRGAREYLQRAYDGRPDAEIAAHLGEVLWELGERNEARRILDEAVGRHPDNELLRKTRERLKL